MGLAKAMAVIGTLSVLALPGCDSTQSKNARAELKAKRELGARKPLRVTRANPAVTVTGVTAVRGGKRGAIVVDLRSSAAEPLTDVPILVGVRTPDGRREPLNVKGGGWFAKHVPAIAAGGRTTWVFARRRGIPAGKPFAKVGTLRAAPLSRATSLPQIDAEPEGGTRGAKARVRVDNASDVPQYGLQVYAVVRAGGRYVAAGRTELEHLGTGQRATAQVALAGRPGRRAPTVIATPTMFD